MCFSRVVVLILITPCGIDHAAGLRLAVSIAVSFASIWKHADIIVSDKVAAALHRLIVLHNFLLTKELKPSLLQ